MIDKSIVVIGGGTGTFSVLTGLKKITSNVSAIVTMADSGGSAKKERDEWGLLPSSDIRKSLIALADVSKEDSLLLRQLFQYRFHQGHSISGMTFGNLFLVTLTKILGSQKKAIEKAGELLNIKGKVLPVTLKNINLMAIYEDGSKVIGEHNIDEPKHHNGELHIVDLKTQPHVNTTRDVTNTLKKSDMIILGPGGFYTTILANLVIGGVVDAIIKSNAIKIFILNLMTEYGQTYNFTATKFLSELNKYFPIKYLNYVFVNNNNIPIDVLRNYNKYHAIPVIDDLNRNAPYKIISDSFLSLKIYKKEKGDRLRRSLIRHSPEKIMSVCKSILNLL